jgi:hypothetical protein
MMTSETNHHYRLGRFAARNISKGLDKNQEKNLLCAIFEDSQFIKPNDFLTPIADFTTGYADEMFERCPRPNESEKRMHADFFNKAKGMVIVGLYQRPISKTALYTGPSEPSVD